MYKVQGKRVVLRPLQEWEEKKEEKSASGIILTRPEPVRIFQIEAEVLAPGNETGLSEGTKVLINPHQADRFEWKGEKCLIIMAEDIIAIDNE